MISLARYVSDRGDAERGLTLLRRAGAPAEHELVQRDDGEPDGTLVWFEHVITHGMERIRAHLELSGDELHVHANSEARFERVLATIRALDPSVTVLRETREPAGDVRAIRRLAARGSTMPAGSPVARSHGQAAYKHRQAQNEVESSRSTPNWKNGDNGRN